MRSTAPRFDCTVASSHPALEPRPGTWSIPHRLVEPSRTVDYLHSLRSCFFALTSHFTPWSSYLPIIANRHPRPCSPTHQCSHPVRPARGPRLSDCPMTDDASSAGKSPSAPKKCASVRSSSTTSLDHGGDDLNAQVLVALAINTSGDVARTAAPRAQPRSRRVSTLDSSSHCAVPILRVASRIAQPGRRPAWPSRFLQRTRTLRPVPTCDARPSSVIFMTDPGARAQSGNFLPLARWRGGNPSGIHPIVRCLAALSAPQSPIQGPLRLVSWLCEVSSVQRARDWRILPASPPGSGR